MSMFLPISTFKDLYVSHSDLLTEEGLQSFLEALQGPEGQLICEGNHISKTDLDQFILSVKNPTNIIYYGWVGEDKRIITLLQNKEISEKFIDQNNHLKHQLAESYKNFISPQLADRLLSYPIENDMLVLSKLFSYTQLLDTDHRALVESQLFKPIQSNLEAAKLKSANIETESELIELIQPLCSDEIVECVNCLSKALYELKIGFVDEVLNYIRHNSCTVRLANWIFKRMELIELNREHLQKIATLKRELKVRDLTVRNHGMGKTPIRWKNVVTFGVFCLILTVIIYIIYKKPFSSVNEPLFSTETSFKQFSKEDRKKIDSLLKEMNGKSIEDDLYLDQGGPLIGSSATLVSKKPFENTIMGSLFEDLNKDAEIQENEVIDSCSAEIKFRLLDYFGDLTKKEGSIQAMIKNESDYQVLIIVAENKKGGKIYGMFLQRGETKNFKLSSANTLIAVPGSNYQNYKASPNADNADLPDKSYKYHFCDTDLNYKESINSVYQVKYQASTKAKFMIMGDKGNYFHLLDLNSVLEDF